MRHPDPGRLTLAAHPSRPPDAAVEKHLARCAQCREHVGSLRRTVDLALSGRAASEDQIPPERIWMAITGALAPRPLWRRIVVPAAASLLVGLGAGWLLGSAPPLQRPLATLASVDGTGAAGTASLVERDGVREIVVRVVGVVAPSGSGYLEAWLRGPTGTRLISLGALARAGGGYQGSFTVPADLPMARFPTMEVSAERYDGDAAHSGDSLLRGPLT